MKKHRHLWVLLAVLMVCTMAFIGTAMAAEEDDATQWLIEKINETTDLGQKAELEQILTDIRSGEAVWMEKREVSPGGIQPRDSIRRFSDPITKPGYTVGVFQLKVGFTDAGAYRGIADYYHTKAAGVSVLNMKRVDFAHYAANGAVKAVEEYHLEAAQIRDFIEIDTFYY